MKRRGLTTMLFAAVLAIEALLQSGEAFAVVMYRATVTSGRASLMLPQGSRMVPVMTVNRGAALQVSEVTKNGWRQVLIRGGRWGWVAENEISVGGEVKVGNLPSSRSRSSGGADSHPDFHPALLVIAAKGGYLLPLGSSGGPIFGLDLGFNLSSSRTGRLYLTAQAEWASASAAPLGFSGNATYPSAQVGLVMRKLFDSGFYAGALAGVSLIGVTVGSASASTLQFSMSGLVGYDFRFSRNFSAGPEAGIYDIVLGGYDAIQLRGALRLHF